MQGYPDANTSKTLFQEVTMSKQISVPANVTGNYDAHIYTLPELHTPPPGSTLNLALDFNQYGIGTAPGTYSMLPSANYPIAPVCVVTGPTGVKTAYDGSASLLPTMTTFDFSPYFDGQKRVLYLAFEVHDTTAELYKQGTCTVYRHPQVNNVSELGTYYGANTVATGVTTYVSRSPPADLQTALLLPGSRQWEASEGCYCVATFDDRQMDLCGSVFGGRAFTYGDFVSGAPTRGFGHVSIADALGNFTQLRSWKPIPFHTSGAYFTGLNQNSTLTVTVKIGLEVAPTPENPQLVVLAKPSPDYDPVAIELYKHASQLLPPGCRVGDNASGDFWDNVLVALETAAPFLGRMLPFPGGAAVGQALSMGIHAGRKKRNKKGGSEASDRAQIDTNFASGQPKGQGGKNSVVAKKPKAKKKAA